MTQPPPPLRDRPDDGDLDRLRDAVASGQYLIPALDVADAILAFHREGRRTDDPHAAEEA